MAKSTTDRGVKDESQGSMNRPPRGDQKDGDGRELSRPHDVPESEAGEPLGDRGKGDKTWTPPPGEQGMSNRPDDEG